MPELAEVRTVASSLKKLVGGSKIIDINIIYPKMIKEDLESFKNHILNKTINNITNCGKYLLIDLGDYTLISHLRMEGKYFVKHEEDEINKHEHIIFKLNDGRTLRYHDTRKFGIMFTCLKGYEYEQKEISKLGYEPNDNKLTKEYLYNKINKSNLAIKTLLLDQTIINGLGNIYVDEVLFASSILPTRKGREITLEECNNIISEAKRITDKATLCGGTTIRSYTSSLGVYGTYQEYLMVHTKDVCKKCNNRINKIRVNGRGTYYCSNCQK